MNMLLHEWRQNQKALMMWCLGMLFLVGASVGKTSGMTGENGQVLEAMVMLLPKSMQRIFGLGMVDFSQPIGIFSIIAMYIALIAGLHAVGLGTAAFAREERDRTFEFLYVRGRTRDFILSAKLIADLLQMAALSAFTYLASIAIVRAAEGANIAGPFLPMMLGIYALQLVFYGVGLFASLATRRMRTASNAASAVLMALFLLSLLSDMVAPDGPLKWLSPFAHFDGKQILRHGLSGAAVCGWLALAAALVTVSFGLHRKRDLYT